MRQLNTILNAKNELASMTLRAQALQTLQQFWQLVTPPMLQDVSKVAHLHNGILTLYVKNGSVAAKIKLLNTNLLMQLHNLQQTHARFASFVVTEIVVKVQVVSAVKTPIKRARVLSSNAQTALSRFAATLEPSPLTRQINEMIQHANKTKT
jgi:hypothetical protein